VPRVTRTASRGAANAVFGQFTQLVSEASGWAYGIVFLLAFLDVLVPVVPSEASVITAGVVASAGGLYLPLIIVAAACGAFLGDNAAYLLGRRFGTRATNRFLRGGKGKKTLDWAERQLTQRGGELIVVSRFIPAGRTAVTLAAGTLAFPWRRFVVFDVIAALIWALYASLLGYFGGRAFENEAWKGLILAFGLAFAVTGGVEVVRWFLKRRSGRRPPSQASPDPHALQTPGKPDAPGPDPAGGRPAD
jgi:membrane-associated protein